MEASTATAVLIISSALVFGTSGQSYCLKDADCMRNQYCYDISQTCVNYTKCYIYNRLEGSEPARAANQCGDCLPEHSEVRTADGGMTDSCIGVPKNEEADWTGVVIFSCSVISIFVIVIVGLVINRYLCKNKKICCYKPEDVPEKSAIPMLESRSFGASAPPLPEAQNNNNYGNADQESLPLSYHNSSSIGENYENMKKDRSKPVKAQPFAPPDWINTDPSYNPSDTDGQVVAVTGPRFMAENAATYDEETVPSVWRPTEQPSLPVPNRPFAITIVDEENSTNTASNNARACPASPNREERRYQAPGGGRRYGSAGASTSASENNNDSGNRNGRERSHVMTMVNQISVNAVFYPKDSSGEGN